jgi:hypothetical protein
MVQASIPGARHDRRRADPEHGRHRLDADLQPAGADDEPAGLALFYGGLVRAKNVLSVLMQCVAIVSLVTVLWVAYGYSLAFSTAGMVAGKRTCTASSAARPRLPGRA